MGVCESSICQDRQEATLATDEERRRRRIIKGAQAHDELRAQALQ